MKRTVYRKLSNRFLLYATVLICLPAIRPVSGQAGILTLSGALENALENNYGIGIARAGKEIAAINNNWGTAGRFPTMAFDASSNNSYDPADEVYTGRLSAGVGLNWLLFDGFRVRITKSRLEELESLSSGNLAVMIESTIEDIILAYYNVLLQQEQLEVVETVMELSEDRYRYELEKRELGGSVTFNVLQAQNLYLSDKAAFMNQEVVVRNAMRNLNFIMGEDPSIAWDLDEPFTADTSGYQLNDLESKMISGNRTLENQYTNLLLMEKETALSKAAYAPAVALGTGMEALRSQIAGPDATAVTSGFSPYANLRLTFDIYSAGVRKRSLDIARINEDIARVEIDEMTHALTNELYNLFDFHRVRIALLHVAEENLEAAELNLSIAEEKYRSGVINSFNYRDIQLIYLNAALGRLQAIYRLIRTNTGLTRITGGLLDADQP